MAEQALQRKLQVTLIGLAGGVVLAATKLTAGILGHSFALIADAMESLADVCSALIVWRGVMVAAEPADVDHPYGHGKAEPIAAAIVAAMLLLAAVGISVEAAISLPKPRQAPAGFTLVVLVFVVVIKEALFRLMHRTGTETDSSVIQTEAWHHRSDAITSVAAGIGIAIAILVPGWQKADAIAAIVAAVIIAWNGIRLFRNALAELMDTAPSSHFNEQIHQIASAVPGVDEVEKCLIRKMGYHYFVDMHMQVDPQMTVESAHRIAHDVKDAIRQKLPSVHDVLVHIEPSQQKKI